MKKKQLLLHPKAEQILRQVILKDLANKGRKEYDKPHTEAVVYWMKYLLSTLPSPDLDPTVLITAAYAHDWGYAGLFTTSDSRDFSEIIKNKKLHMQRGAEKIETLLYSRLTKYYTDAQKLDIIHLVSIHDKVRELKTEAEITLMEADTLGALDQSRVTSTLSATDKKRFLEHSIKILRLPRFKHQEAIIAAQQLLNTYA